MKRKLLLTFGIVALLASNMPISASAQEAKGKNCRMEQQCHWENFKKDLRLGEGVPLGNASVRSQRVTFDEHAVQRVG